MLTLLLLIFFCCCCSFFASSSAMLILLLFFVFFFCSFCRRRSSARADIPVMASSSSSAAAPSGVPVVGSSSFSTTPSGVPIVGSSSFSFPPPPLSLSSVSYAYEVFLSYRGVDIRKSFIDHLYVALDQRGIYTFKDDKRLRGGDSISYQLMKAIEQSRSAIVVFSKDFASSIWCLDELEKIMECKEKLGLAVYPVFYDVDPTQVRRQTGTFGKGFARAVKRRADKADAWRKALHDAADLSGYDVQNTAGGHESQCIKQIVEWFWSNYGNIFTNYDENLIGIKPRVRDLVSLLGRDSYDVRMIGIWGMGGSGKTTVATVAFDEISKQFDGVSFIENVREVSQMSGLRHLQKNILSDILMEGNLYVSHVSQGAQMLRQRLCHKKVLIVLDDVDHVEQLRALAGGHSWFGKGSRILITTRNEQLLKAHGIDEIHSVNLLNEDEANQLFNKYAFKKFSRMEGYDELSIRVVHYAAGLPLTLKVLGSFLCDRGTAVWASALERLAKIPENETSEILKISYDGLLDIEKKIFLDIACFFKGWPTVKVVRILDSCEFDPVIGISVLEQKCLITFSGKIQMHDLIQEMGRKIVSQDAPEEPEKHSRLWRYEDISNVLRRQLKGTEAIEAIVDTRQHLACDAKAFESMKKLRILHIAYNKGSFVAPEYLPNELRWLRWYGYPHECLPTSFQAPKLVGLEIRHSNIVQLWEGAKFLDKLKYLTIRDSQLLISCPDFSGIPNLKELNLCGCRSLKNVHPSIRDLQSLVLLDLGWCTDLEDFPSSIHMKSLEFLNFCGCSNFKRFPELLGNMDKLSKLDLSWTAIEGLPSSIANLTKLELIHFNGCENLMDLPDAICMLKHLKMLYLSGCTKLTKLPEDFGYIESLEELWLDESGVVQLPWSIGFLEKLKLVSLSRCKGLRLNEVMSRPLLPLSRLSCLKELHLGRCGLSEQAIPVDIGKLSFLEKLDLRENPFICLPASSISQLSRLKILDLTWCKFLKALPEIPSSIAILMADRCPSLECMEGLPEKCEWLWKLSLVGCSSLISCDHHCHKEHSSITSWKKRTEEGVSEAARGYCLKHSKLTEVVTSMLQGHALFNHRLSIPFSAGIMNPRMWFDQEVEGNQLVLELPPNWQNKSTGFAMCVAFHSEFWYPFVELNISFSKVANNKSVNIQLPSSDPNLPSTDIWIGYLSFNLIRRSCEGVMGVDLMNTAPQLLLTFQATASKAEFCAAHLVDRDDIVDSEVTASSSSLPFSSGLQQEEDPNFAAFTKVHCDKGKETGNGIVLSLNGPVASS